MLRTIDVDAHFEPGAEWLDPYPDLAKRLPRLDPGALAVQTICGDLVESMPAAARPSYAELSPPGLLALFAQEKLDEKDRRTEFEGKDQFQVANAQARLKWMDAQGIDIQNIICLAGVNYLTFVEDAGLRREVVRACNDWLADQCDGSAGRLRPVTALDYGDLDWAVAELGRMRRRGSRMVLIPGAPVDGRSLAHPDWDRLWRAITDNGMIAMLHTGFERMSFAPGWGNMSADATLLRQFGSSFRHVTPMMLISALVFGGAFERNPALTLLIAELGCGWLPFFIRDIDDRATPLSQLFLGEWKNPMRPSDYVARNVRATPLSGGNDSPIVRIMEDLPEDMIVFSSDFPHFEGFGDPKAFYADALAGLGEDRRRRFFGGAVADAYARMGDPV